MPIQLTGFNHDGNHVVTLTGEALPKYPRLPAPPDCKINLLDEDFNKLKKAFLRFMRAINANEKVGNISLNFNYSNSELNIKAKIPIEDNVKLLALEMRPFFLEEDPLCFNKILSLRSFGGKTECIRPCLKQHRLRWENSEFGGKATIVMNGKALDTDAVVRAWFNSDFFHTESKKTEELSLEELISLFGDNDYAITLLAQHMMASLQVINEFFEDINKVSSQFKEWEAGIAFGK